ncbi:DUF2863 family protein [Massilia sp. R2A-15]|uniref:DUF2863 family protein n=1 Tax=Massilia sp. R2A-15 TaxID=3064278 RepID=UPI0027360869|nr:DUF2863 family protein [Massilia sp. R2A-15]WLI91334.1 DUF2863 family protein [Massilia sp. R2A-15]
MPKNKRPVPRKSASAPEDNTEQMAQALADLALDIAEREEDDPAALREKEAELARLVRNALRKKNDEVLYGAIEQARFTDAGAFGYLRGKVEEAAATTTLRREGRPAEEIDAFLVPVFVSTTGGLKQEQTFQDVAAFELLRASFQQAGLESADATVVLISHAYDLDEIDRISYSQLNDMLREVAATMSEKKMVDTPVLSASIAGWSGGGFAPEDEAMELRFLLGFVRRRADDPFYAEPAGEAAAEAWYDARMERYRQWTLDAAPLLQACLAADPSSVSLNFLYQDLFYGAKEQGMAELAMLGVMSEIGQALEAHAVDPAELSAIVAPAASGDELTLRINLYRGGEDGPMVSAEKGFDLAGDVEAELDELCEALRAMGIQAVSVADKFDADGQAVGVRTA